MPHVIGTDGDGGHWHCDTCEPNPCEILSTLHDACQAFRAVFRWDENTLSAEAHGRADAAYDRLVTLLYPLPEQTGGTQ